MQYINNIGEKMYIDPGTGSIIVQAVIAAVLFLGVFTKLFWTKLVSLFKKKNPADTGTKQDGE
jgi:hypothetical protein